MEQQPIKSSLTHLLNSVSKDGLNLPIPVSNVATNNQADSLSDKDKQRLTDWVKNSFTKAKSDRWQSEKQWYLNLAFYFGKQNVQAIETKGAASHFKLVTPPAPYYRSRPVINKVRPLMRTEMAKLSSQRPDTYVVPSSSNDDDLFAAQAAEQIWSSIQDSHKLDAIFRRAIFWTSTTGNGFIKSFWNDAKVDQLNQLQGDIDYQTVPPFHIFVPDLTEVELECQPFVLHASMRNKEQIASLYQQAQQQTAESIRKTTDKLGEIDEAYNSVMDTVQSKKNQTLVVEAWVKPGVNSMLPGGGLVTIVGDQLINFWPQLPYEHGEFPFAHIRHIETGKFYADSVITDLIPLQREFNRTRGQIIESKNKMSKPQLAAELGSIDHTKVTSEPGQIIFYRPGFKAPTPIPLQGIPSYVLQELDRIESDMNDISGQHEVTKGQTPPGVTAATAISFLQEQDEGKLTYTFTSIEEATAKIARQTLFYVKQYWDVDHQIKITGVDGTFDVQMFQGADLRDNTDVRTEAGSAMPVSKAAKQAFIMDLMKFGFIDPQRGLELLEIGGAEKLYDQIQIDVRQAQRENLRMAQVTDEQIQQWNLAQKQQLAQQPGFAQALQTGEIQIDQQGNIVANGVVLQPPLIVPVNNWDNNAMHIERHNRYRKSQAFDALSPVAKKLFDDHVNAHQQAMQQEQMQQAAMQSASMAGNGSGPGSPPPGGAQDSGGTQPNQFSGMPSIES